MRKSLLPAGVLAATAAIGAALFATLGYAAPNETAAQAQYAPNNTAPPTINDTTPQVGQTLTATTGTWTGDQPIVFTFQWQRCNPGGQSCVAIPGATNQSYTVQATDQGNTLRVAVTATNASGARTANSAVTSRVEPAGPPPPVAGQRIAVTAVNLPDRLVIDQVRFNPNPIRSRTTTLTVRVHVVDTRGRIVQGALVFARSTPLVTTAPPEQPTGADGWVTLTSQTQRDFSIVFRPGYNLQWFVRARKPGENPLAGVSTRRLVQVTVRPG